MTQLVLSEDELLLKWNRLVQEWHEDELLTLGPLSSHDEGLTCDCVYDHRPPVLEYQIHHILPIYLGGPDVASNRITLCPTTHGNVHEVMRLLVRDRMLTYAEVRAINKRIVTKYSYALAVDGFQRWRVTQNLLPS